ncbi:MAG: sulfotransferase [Myxococcales bacterium]|nr:sulfotransferase [Myxococcales bacterium]MDH5307089.1 sulfotransferase [Myxococcales bacterium]MDH5565066.1 sulfotransferase [Myxococcales bacterium]
MARDFVTLVSGVPRSGTSLMMQMLGAGGFPLLTDGLREPDEHNPRGYFEFEAAKRTLRDTSWLAQALGRAVKLVHALVASLPDAYPYRVILLRRPLGQVVASQRAMLARFGGVEGVLPDARLSEIFAAQLADLERWAEGQPRVTLLGVETERLVADPAAVASEVAAFLGGELDEAAMAGAYEPSLWHQRD